MSFEALLDVVWTGRHSRYFNQARSHYLCRRARTIAFLMMVLQPAWILVDYLLLPASLLEDVSIWRMTSGLICAGLALWASCPYSLWRGYVRLLGLLVTLSCFHIFTSNMLVSAGHGGTVAGYHFFPFMVICMLAVFPLTILELLLMVGGIILLELSLQAWQGMLWQIESLNNLWLLAILGVISGWAAVNQLSMLLGLFRQATRDPLTGLSNRRQSMEQLETDMRTQREMGKSVSVLMFDLDHFKRFNDQYGHAAGDIVLREFGKIMRKHARKRHDLSGRYGGEEFLMILPGLAQPQAAELATNILHSCRSARAQTPTGEQISFTTSIGLATSTPEDDVASLLKKADDALYQAKGNGRDQVQIALSSQSEPQKVEAAELI